MKQALKEEIENLHILNIPFADPKAKYFVKI